MRSWVRRARSAIQLLNVRLSCTSTLSGGVGLHFGEFFRRVPVEQRIRNVRRGTHRSNQHNLSGQLALVLLQILHILNVEIDSLSRHRTLGRGGPRRSLRHQRLWIGRYHPDPRVDLLPTHAELAPVLQVRILQANLRQRIARPRICLRHVRRARQPRPDPVAQRLRKLHYMRVLEALLTNPRIHREIDILGRRLRPIVRRCLRRLLRWGLLRCSLISGKGRGYKTGDGGRTTAPTRKRANK